jgi:putative salt-induced outer membrane protein YdiY
MPMPKAVLTVLFAALLSSPALAQAPKDSAPPPLKVSLDLGYLNAAGNTNVTTFSSGEALTYKTPHLELLQNGSAVYGTTGDSTIAEQYKIGARVNFPVSKIVGVFVGGGFEKNRFAGIAHRFQEDAGLAFRVLNLERDTWLIEVGGSLNQERNTVGTSRDFASLRSAMSYRHGFTKTAFLQEDFEVLPNTENFTDTRVNNTIALAAPLSVHVALKVAYQVKFDNVPEPGFQKSDRVFTTGVQITF